MFKAVHMTVIKGYHFPEPVWKPGDLTDTFQYLADAEMLWEQIWKDSKRDLGKFLLLFDRHRPRMEVEGLGWIKPLRNPRHTGSAFWLNLFPEHLREGGGLDYRRPLPLFPLQVLPYKSQVEIVIEKGDLARWLGEGNLVDLKVSPQLTIYPAGMVTAQLRLYLEGREELDLDSLAGLSDRLAAWPIQVWNEEGEEQRFQGVFELFEHLVGLLLAQVVREEGGISRAVKGYCLVFNLQGQVADLAPHRAALARLLAGRASVYGDYLSRKRLPASLTKARDSLIALDRCRAFLYIDPELTRRRARKGGERASIISGRRFFRQKFLTTVELAYLSAALLKEYGERFTTLEQGLRLADLESDPISRLWNRFQLGVLSPRAYGTLTDSVFQARQRLGRDPSANGPLWQAVYDRVMAGQAGATLLKDLEQHSQEIYDLAIQYRGRQAKQLQGMAEGVVKVAKDLLPALVKVELG